MIERINLLPSKQRGRSGVGNEILHFLLALGLVLIVLVAFGAREIALGRSLEKRRNELVASRDGLLAEQRSAAADLGRIKILFDEKVAVQARLDALAALQQGRRSWADLLVGIGRLIPEGLWLTSLEGVPGADTGGAPTLRFHGKALSHERVSALLGALERDERFRDVELVSTAKGTYRDNDVIDFTLSCQVRAR